MIEPVSGSGASSDGTPEVKSLTFVTLRSFLPEYFGEDTSARILASLPTQTASILNMVEAGEWIAETHMQSVLHKVFEIGVGLDDEAFSTFARALAGAGVSRFMGVFLSLASERFVLRKIPVVWNRLRRNAGSVTSEVDKTVARVRYEGFPFFGDGLYRLLSIANCQALAFAATNRIPPGRVVTYDVNTLVLEFELS